MNPRTKNTVVTRFAPSPTGMFHVGGIRSALYNYLFARKHGGVYILRCEDTDKKRSKKEYEEYFLEVFRWLGLEHDEYYRQSERTAVYRGYLERLIAEGKAYVSKEKPKNEGEREEVIRFKNPGTDVTFDDVVLGTITFNTQELGDFVIARELDEPIYHFTVVVDDFEMGVTHIIRGQEHVSNTARQILIQEAIGAPRPIYAHASIILNEERAKLSKRDPTVRPALEYREEGYLPEALLNFMALLGWNPGTEQEVFSKDELVEAFSLERMQKAGAIFNPEKLEWINKEHIKRLSDEERLARLIAALPENIRLLSGYSDTTLAAAMPVILERITHFGEVRQLAEAGEIAYLFADPEILSIESLIWKNLKGRPDSAELTRTHLRHAIDLIKTHSGPWTAESLKETIWPYADAHGRGDVLWPVRYALSGRDKSPDPFQLMAILGRETSIRRLTRAHELLHA
jgi:glutamyl-tRNA synthetase